MIKVSSSKQLPSLMMAESIQLSKSLLQNSHLISSAALYHSVFAINLLSLDNAKRFDYDLNTFFPFTNKLSY